jgi:hypothetical protein
VYCCCGAESPFALSANPCEVADERKGPPGSSEVQSVAAPSTPIYMYDELLIAYFVRALVKWMEALDGFHRRRNCEARALALTQHWVEKSLAALRSISSSGPNQICLSSFCTGALQRNLQTVQLFLSAHFLCARVAEKKIERRARLCFN